MDLGLRGKIALVAASSKGIGKAIALGLAREGCSLAICARTTETLEQTAAEIREDTGSSVLAVTADLTRPEDIERLVSATVERYGGIDILVTNAGGPPSALFEEIDDDTWLRSVELTLMSAVRLIRESLPYLKRSRAGRIITMTSVSVKQPLPGLLLSNSIRMAVWGLTKTLAQELAPFGITVNTVCPGWTKTRRVEELLKAKAEREGISVEEAEALS